MLPRALLALLLLGCSDRTDLLPLTDGGCGAPISLGDECAGAAAAKRLRYALCSCSPLVLERGLFTEGGSGSGMTGPPPAAVGSDEHIQIAGPAQVAGVLEAAGLLGVSFNHAAGILGTLRSGGTLLSSSAQFLSIYGDAFVDGDVLGRIDIGGILNVPVDAAVSTSVVAQDIKLGPVEVPPPCDCGAAPDLAGAIAEHTKVNDNAAIHLSPEALAGGQTVLDLPCGAYYLSQIKTPPMQELELRVHGRAALFVAGDVYLGDSLRVNLDAMAELDLVIGGDLYAPFGIAGGPTSESVRVWLAGTTLRAGDPPLRAAIYAPNATVIADDNLSVDGALFAAAISAPGDVGIRYDAEILNAGVSCGAAPEMAVQ
jgi:hypothetical protein